MPDDVNHPAKWERDYRSGTARWSLKTPTPVFQALLAETNARGEPVLPPGRVLVPGAGLGHDARELARHGFEVVAVDFAQDAAEAMRDALTPGATHEILQQDFFQLPAAWNETFDYILEYTCYCAIDPRRRTEYADKIASLLNRGGIYIALVYPLAYTGTPPPFVVDTDTLAHDLAARDFQLLRREFHPATIKPRLGREELLVMQKS